MKIIVLTLVAVAASIAFILTASLNPKTGTPPPRGLTRTELEQSSSTANFRSPNSYLNQFMIEETDSLPSEPGEEKPTTTKAQPRGDFMPSNFIGPSSPPSVVGPPGPPPGY